jgi:hypothetical protein
MFLIDLGIVASLITVRPGGEGAAGSLKKRLAVAIGVVTVGVAAAGFARQRSHFASLPNPTASANVAQSSKISPIVSPVYATNHAQPRRADYFATTVSKTQCVADIGTEPAGRTVTVLFQIASPNHQKLQIRGVSTSCGCTDVPNPPKAIPEAGTADVVVTFHVPDHAVDFKSEILMTTDNPSLPPFSLLIRGSAQ